MRVLVLNPSKDDDYESLVKIVNKQAQKSGLDICICLASFPNPMKLEASIPMYCLGSNTNPIGLGDKGIFKLEVRNQSIKIGLENVEEGVDILITTDWPRRIAIEQQKTQFSSSELDEMVLRTPRYWFASGTDDSSLFCERQAFQNGERVCRFISLAKKGQGRWFYAFNLPFEDDITSMKLLPLPEVSNLSLKRKNGDEDENTTKRIHLITPEECFLCLTNSKFETHMVIDKSPNAYLAITKGPLGLDNGKGFIGHGMIVPIEHSALLPTPLKESSFYTQFKLYEEQLIKLFTSSESTVKNTNSFSLIFWQISNKDQVHGHIQFLPVLKSQALDLEKKIRNQIEFDLKVSKRRGVEKPKLQLMKFKPGDDLTEFWSIIDTKPYIYFGLHGEDGLTRYILPVDEEYSFDNQFARKTIAVLINQKDKVNWKKCVRGVEFEQNESERFKKYYRSI